MKAKLSRNLSKIRLSWQIWLISKFNSFLHSGCHPVNHCAPFISTPNCWYRCWQKSIHTQFSRVFSDFISRYIYTFTYLVPFCRLHEVNYIKKKTKKGSGKVSEWKVYWMNTNGFFFFLFYVPWMNLLERVRRKERKWDGEPVEFQLCHMNLINFR